MRRRFFSSAERACRASYRVRDAEEGSSPEEPASSGDPEANIIGNCPNERRGLFILEVTWTNEKGR